MGSDLSSIAPEDRHVRHVRVLLVEDDPADITLLNEALAEIPGLTAEVTETGSLVQSLAMAQQGREFDVMLLDLRLPNGQGRAVFKAVSDAFPVTPIIILTGIDDPWYRRELLAMGATNYLTKSRLTHDALDVALSQAVEKAAVLREARTALTRLDAQLRRLR